MPKILFSINLLLTIIDASILSRLLTTIVKLLATIDAVLLTIIDLLLTTIVKVLTTIVKLLTITDGSILEIRKNSRPRAIPSSKYNLPVSITFRKVFPSIDNLPWFGRLPVGNTFQ